MGVGKVDDHRVERPAGVVWDDANIPIAGIRPIARSANPTRDAQAIEQRPLLERFQPERPESREGKLILSRSD
jgi:hypothetical protein